MREIFDSESYILVMLKIKNYRIMFYMFWINL